jgi:hypothetical protein
MGENFDHETLPQRKLSIKSTLRIFLRNCRDLIVYPDIAAARFAVALNGLSWSLMLILASSDVLLDPVFSGLSQIGDRTFWAVCMGAIGAVQMFTLIARVPPSWHTSLIAFTSLIMWTYVTVSLMLSAITNVAVLSTTGVIAWLSIWIFVRSRFGNEPDMRRRITD